MVIITIGTKLQDDKGNTYVLDKVLGSGGFGDVYKAHSEADGMPVAVKLLKNNFYSPEAVLSFQKETYQSKLLDSENVIKYLYFHDGQQFDSYPPYIIMEYTDGGTLRNLIDNQGNQQFDIEMLKRMLLQLARAMKCINTELVHRDIKPENILNFNGVLKITDFGLSKIAGESTNTMTFKNGGTLAYIAPEAWNNEKNTVQMDIYSMGIVFYELATLSYPYKNIPLKPNFSEWRNMHLFDPIINPSSINKGLPPNITSMIIKMLAKPTQERFKNWDEIISILESEPLPKDDLAEIVKNAVSLRNQKDLQIQKEITEKRRKEEKKKEYIQLAYSEYCNSISSVINEFVERFKNMYSNPNSISVKERPPLGTSTTFSTEISMPTGFKISILGQIILKENYNETVQSRFGETYQINKAPKCEDKEVILWCQLSDNEGFGFNLLLLKNPMSIYGDWYILENTNGAFSKYERPSPFGFDLKELPEEIHYLHTLHVYNLNLFPFTDEKLIGFIAERV